MYSENLNPNHPQPLSEALEALGESSGLVQGLIENLPGGAVFVLDQNLRYLLAAGEALAIWECQSTDFVGRTVLEALLPGFPKEYEGFCRRTLAGKPDEWECTCHGRTYRTRGTPLRSPQGEIHAVLVVFFDITAAPLPEEDGQSASFKNLQQHSASVSSELRDTQLLQQLSAKLLTEGDIQVLYDEILTTAIALMQADMGSLQLFDPERQELRLLIWKGFHPDSAVHWQTVTTQSTSFCGAALLTLERLIIPDVHAADLNNTNDTLQHYRKSGIVAMQSTPILSHQGRPLGMISTHWRKPHQPEPRELQMFDRLVRQVGNILERARTEEALRESEAKYRILFETMDQGFGIAEILVDETDRPIDYRMLELNPQFAQLTGRSAQAFLSGQTVREVAPELEEEWYQFYGSVGLTGIPAQREIHVQAWDRWYQVSAYRTGAPEQRRVSIIYTDITQSKQVQEQLRRAAELSAFRVLLNDAVRSLTDPEDIKYQAVCVLGQQLGSDRAYYVEIDQARSEFIVARDWHQPGTPSHARRYPMEDWPLPWLVDGQPWVIRNVDTDPALPDDQRSSYRGNDIGALILVPLIKNGCLVATLATNQTSPRDWTPDEIALVQETADRTWAAVERARAEEALRLSEQKYRSLFNSIDEGFGIIERVPGEPIDFLYLEANPGFAIQTGISDIVGKTIRSAFPQVPETVYEIYQNVLETGEAIRFVIQVPDIDSFLEVYAFRIIDEPDRLAAIFTNITDRRRANAQLRQAAELDRFRVLLNDALRPLADPVEIQAKAMGVLGEHLGVVCAQYWEAEPENQQFISEGGYAPGMPSIQGGDRLKDLGVYIQSALTSGQTLAINDVFADPRIGEAELAAYQAFGFRSSVSVPLVKAGRLVAALSLYRAQPHDWTEEEIAVIEETADRTWGAIERATAEKALRQSEIQRLQEQAAREEERQRAAQEAARSEALAELDRAKTRFFSNISHEFRTPLTLILAPLEDTLEQLTAWENQPEFNLTPSPGQPLASLKEQLELARRNSLRLLKLVNSLLDFSRIEAGRLEAIYEPTDLAQFTTEIASLFRSAIERAGLTFRVDCQPLPPLYVDRPMWEKIVLNLLSNALKFTLTGDITLSLRAKNSHQAILSIQDTGPGIAPEHLPHLFERFYQIRGTAQNPYEGSGIGLALVHELVRLQGGSIAVTSKVGQGTTFSVTLPFGTAHLPPDRIQTLDTDPSPSQAAIAYLEDAQRQLPPAPSPTVPEPDPQTAAVLPHVLIVDDNADMRAYLTRILSPQMKVEAVADATSALAALQVKPFDLILSDVMMPGLDGFGLLLSVRADPETRELPVILLSARAEEEAILAALEAQADDYIIKPFSAQELVMRIKTHLAIKHLRTEALHQARTTLKRKDELLNVVSHELNTPLASILGWTRLLRATPQTPRMVSTGLNAIEHSAMMQEKLVQDLLDISRITANKLRLHLQPTELEPIIQRAIETVAQMAEEKGVELTWRETAECRVQGDGDRLEQVICNLLSNGIKFTPKGGRVDLYVSQVTDRGSGGGEQTAENDKSPISAYAEIRVTDTGIGIPPDFLPHLFEKFRQADEQHSHKGLGLGLAIAHHLVKLHQGTIQADSPGVGQGATFIIRLPLLQ
ncbi:MAG: ATP-binding protein [Chroococcales cyanobacterium]